MESKIVTAVGISVNSVLGADASKRLEEAMSRAVIECTAKGISTEEENSAIIRAAMKDAYDRELAAIEANE